MALTELNTYTLNDIYNLPDGQRAELIDGKVYYMAPNTRKHQRIVGELFATIREHIRKNNAKGEVDITPFSVFIDADDKSYVEPDICVICDENKLDDRGCNGAPDWIIEVVSDSSRKIDYTTKLFKYRTSGVREYWIVDPAKNRVMVYNFTQDDMKEYSFTEDIPAGIYNEFTIRMSNLEM
jgi:Uma2 family endonuclease